jgi:hypothetical protein
MRATYPEKANLTLFPLPEFCLFIGYTLILTIDKVLFDTHGLLGKSSNKGDNKRAVKGEDPADVKFITDVIELLDKDESSSPTRNNPTDRKKRLMFDLKEATGTYLNKQDRMFTRMRASMSLDENSPRISAKKENDENTSND